MHPILHVKKCHSQQPRKSLITKHDVHNRSMIVVRESVFESSFITVIFINKGLILPDLAVNDQNIQAHVLRD